MPGALHELIAARRDVLLERFLAHVARRPPRAGATDSELKDDLGAVLNQIVYELRRATGAEAPTPGIENPARIHGAQRLELGASLTSVVEEYGTMFQLVVDLAEEAGLALSHDEVRVLGRATNAAIGASTAEYVAGREADMAREARFREQFIAILGHDLRTPLSSIAMAASMLAHGVAADALPKLAARLARSVERMQQMIEDVLDLALGRTEAGIPLAPAAMDAFDVACEVIDELRLAKGDAPIDLAKDGATRGRWDRDRLARAIANLVGNAVAYRAPGTRVHVRVDGDDAAVRIAVHNQGAPIPNDELRSLFDPFRRGRAAPPGGGLGLGLFITKQIAEAHGGAVHVTSSADAGTTFTIELPREARPRA